MVEKVLCLEDNLNLILASLKKSQRDLFLCLRENEDIIDEPFMKALDEANEKLKESISAASGSLLLLLTDDNRRSRK